MRKFIYILSSVILIVASFGTAQAQLNQLQHICSLYFSPEYISDGQEYFAQLKPDQKVEFRTTFFSENTYRIVACTNLRRSDVIFSVYDTEKNLLFTNSNYNNSPYWDFRFASTVTCIIQVDVLNQKFTPGYVMLLIGYKP
ncbi:MAG: hypothetical protein RBT74_08145 [Tenuifilaceae bacterium]|jgi:hypothetical protein|nr:hypothetical protein [Tenuifilaceae bacterium]